MAMKEHKLSNHTAMRNSLQTKEPYNSTNIFLVCLWLMVATHRPITLIVIVCMDQRLFVIDLHQCPKMVFLAFTY